VSMFFPQPWSCPTFPISEYKVVQIWSGRFVCKQVTVCPGHIWTTLYLNRDLLLCSEVGDSMSFPKYLYLSTKLQTVKSQEKQSLHSQSWKPQTSGKFSAISCNNLKCCISTFLCTKAMKDFWLRHGDSAKTHTPVFIFLCSYSLTRLQFMRVGTSPDWTIPYNKTSNSSSLEKNKQEKIANFLTGMQLSHFIHGVTPHTLFSLIIFTLYFLPGS
jgi:hypothetical protein